MPSRPTVRCCRAARHIRPPLDNIWITDSVLATAFERYSHVSRLSRRKSSSVPGPLENRRRLGKKQMSGLYSENHQPTLPPWLIEQPVNLTQWKWKAPSSPESRQRAAASLRRASLAQVENMLSWMDRWLPDEAKPRPQFEEMDDTAELESGLDHHLEHALSALPKSIGRIDPEYFQAMNALQKDIYLGLIPFERAFEALRSFPASLAEQFTGMSRKAQTSFVEKATRRFYSAVADGLAFSKVQGLAHIDAGLCQCLFEQISVLPASPETGRLFHWLLASAPKKHSAVTKNGFQLVMRQWFAGDLSRLDSSLGVLGNILNGTSPARHKALLRAAGTAVQEACAACGAAGRKARQSRWLNLQARMPQIQEEQFLQAYLCATTAGSQSARFSQDAQFCKLLLHQWHSQGTLNEPGNLRQEWETNTRQRPELKLGALAYHITRHTEGKVQDELLLSYFRLLAASGSYDRFVASLRLWCSSRNSLRTSSFNALAKNTQDHLTALELLQMLNKHRSKFPLGSASALAWGAWTPHVKAMIFDSTVHPRVVWEAVNAVYSRTHGKLAVRQKQELVANMAVWYAQAGHLSDRAKMRYVSRCNAWLQAQGVPISSSGLLAVLQAVTRDLKMGNAGRTARLNWALEMIQKHQGPEEAEKAGVALERWRKRNAELARA